MRMQFSVIICTYNRAQYLARMLERLAQCECPPRNRWEALVVDNGSQDQTAAVAEKFKPFLPLVYAIESRRGKSNALNLGVQRARSDRLIFLDDDVLADPRLLAEYDYAFDRYRDADLFGGPVNLVLPERHDPDLIALTQARFVLAQSDFGPVTMPLIYPNFPIGGNMAARRSVVARVGFTPVLLSNGKPAELALEDCLFFKRAMLSGHRVMYLPHARVGHIVREDQLGLEYFKERYSQALIGQELMDDIGSCARIFNVPRYHLRRLARRALRLLVHAPLGRRERLSAYVDLAAQWRTVKYYRRVARCAA